jgi:capsular exopolysaccharide synthesis family protein
MRKHEAEEAEKERAKEAEAVQSPEPDPHGAADREAQAPNRVAAATLEATADEDAPDTVARADAPAVDTVAAVPAPETSPAASTVGTAMARPAPRAAGAPATIVKEPPQDADYSELLMAHHDRGGAVTEEYRAVRTSLLAQNPDERFCYLITSANVGEGKSVTAANLALVMAERIDRRTILVDCDLRKHMLANYLSADNVPGMVELLHTKATLKQAIQPTVYPNLFFLPAGEVPEEEVAELVGRPELEEIVAELRRQYDYVIFDSPPINVVSDAGMLGQAAGEALLVVRMHKTHRESVDKALRLLHAANVKPAGIILTHRRFLIPNYLYRYS